ncbi:hypothetical protein KCP78_18640 [Salmonella enterica subsp. enterica]|nr:hypothetical protein KCP78_18640 [Salmonella enterica subsp. enterica]
MLEGSYRSSLPYSASIWIRLWVRGRKAGLYRKRWGERCGFYRRPVETGRNHATFRLDWAKLWRPSPHWSALYVIAIPICYYRNDATTNRLGRVSPPQRRCSARFTYLILICPVKLNRFLNKDAI